MLKRIKENEKICLSPEHNPPMNIVLQPGIYKHTCPSCGWTYSFNVPQIYSNTVQSDT